MRVLALPCLAVSRLPVAAEDEFALIDLSGPPDDLLPEFDVMQEIVATAESLGTHWRFLWDLRNLGETVYQDSIDAFSAGWDGAIAPVMLVPPGRTDDVRRAFQKFHVETVEMDPKPLPFSDLDVELFDPYQPSSAISVLVP